MVSTFLYTLLFTFCIKLLYIIVSILLLFVLSVFEFIVQFQMARWYRGGRYYGKNRYYSRYSKKSYGYYRGKGQVKAAKQQADNAKVVLNVPTQISCFNENKNFSIGGETETNQVGCYAMNIYDLLRKSEFYQSYANMYDEFKIENIKVKLIPVAFNVVAGTNSTKYASLTVYTAWDRTGLSQEQVRLIGNNVGADSNVIGTTDEGNADGLYCIVGDNITTYSSSESRQVQPGANCSIVRYLSPKTAAEKGSWISTSVIDKWYESYDLNNGRFIGIPTNSGLNDFDVGKLGVVGGFEPKVSTVSWSPMVKSNPCFVIESPEVKFKPTLLVGVYPSVDNANAEFQGDSNKILFNVETEILCTFRGLRKASIVV